jgi:hypothetical protein
MDIFFLKKKDWNRIGDKPAKMLFELPHRINE